MQLEHSSQQRYTLVEKTSPELHPSKRNGYFSLLQPFQSCFIRAVGSGTEEITKRLVRVTDQQHRLIKRLKCNHKTVELFHSPCLSTVSVGFWYNNSGLRKNCRLQNYFEVVLGEVKTKTPYKSEPFCNYCYSKYRIQSNCKPDKNKNLILKVCLSGLMLHDTLYQQFSRILQDILTKGKRNHCLNR